MKKDFSLATSIVILVVFGLLVYWASQIFGSPAGQPLPDDSFDQLPAVPDDLTLLPDGTIVERDGTKRLPNGTVIRPDGTILPMRTQ